VLPHLLTEAQVQIEIGAVVHRVDALLQEVFRELVDRINVGLEEVVNVQLPDHLFSESLASLGLVLVIPLEVIVDQHFDSFINSRCPASFKVLDLRSSDEYLEELIPT